MTRFSFLAFVCGLWVLYGACPAAGRPRGGDSDRGAEGLWRRRREVIVILSSVEDLLQDVLALKDDSREELGISTKIFPGTLRRFLREVQACKALLETSWPKDKQGKHIEKPCKNIRFPEVAGRVNAGRQAAPAKAVAGTSEARTKKPEGQTAKLASPVAVKKTAGTKKPATAARSKRSRLAAFGRGAWNVISNLPRSARVLAKRITLITRRKLPLSWKRFVWGLPRTDPAMVPEFKAVLDQLTNKDRTVMLVDRPSPALQKLLAKAAETHKVDSRKGTFQPGQLAVKGRVFNPSGASLVGLEVNGQLRIAPRSAFILPAYGAWVAGLDKSLVKTTEVKEENAPKAIVYMVMPRVRGDVQDYLYESKQPMDFRYTAAEMIYSLYQLHNAGFLHRDIKLMNFFLSYSGHVLLADFDGVWPIGIPVTEEEYMVFTDGYLAPEVDMDQPAVLYTVKSDIYAVGVCLGEFLEARPNVPDAALLKHLSELMTKEDPEKRISLEEAMRHAYFAGIDFETLENMDYPPPMPGDFRLNKTFYNR
ncbi:rhoptry kinase family protein rop35 [Cystoisospora suis]|uniref:Rhoptry kinase family protein rop35 n=1 Tax=Cystoisospora suis TaxID=483139 RepID=A0A2C6L7C4_9APIC|nr:rhoptry kinase family protein rop35 [Cystoisospora suis]